jgi:hypothetical protein
MVTYLHLKSPSYNPFSHKPYLLGLAIKFSLNLMIMFSHYI